MAYINAIIFYAQWEIITMYIRPTYGKVFGGTPNILIFQLFLENGSILKQ